MPRSVGMPESYALRLMMVATVEGGVVRLHGTRCTTLTLTTGGSMTAQVSWLTEDDYLEATQLEAELWEVSSPLGVSLHAMRQLGHWRPFSPGFIERRAESIARAIRPYVPAPQRAHPVLDQIAGYAEEILNNSHSEHDVRLWASEILSLVANLNHGDTSVAPRNR